MEHKVSWDRGIFSAFYRNDCFWFTREIGLCSNQQWAPPCILLPVLQSNDFLAYFSFSYYYLHFSASALKFWNLQRFCDCFWCMACLSEVQRLRSCSWAQWDVLLPIISEMILLPRSCDAFCHYSMLCFLKSIFPTGNVSSSYPQ